MSDSTRKSILAQFTVILASLASLKKVESKKISPVDLDTAPFPCAFIYGGTESKLTDGRAVIGYESWLWRITVEVWGKKTDMEDLLKSIHDLMWEQRTIGGFAVTCERVGSTFYVVDVAQEIEAMTIDFDVLYRHAKGVM